ncbi:hypothetical protein XELAEV_18009377mg [Xenopus laevis]|uniref:Uncharacterized protein n=1 Tax=Xenopus laevis TaxID=8355 RepID=A0A974DS96_XENLA|nr:hypothetical protein XELAEV_18009377mg [Xenopus laevis]
MIACHFLLRNLGAAFYYTTTLAMETQQAKHRSSKLDGGEASGLLKGSSEGGNNERAVPDPAALDERRREARGYLESISHHSYWFDVWIFLLFDLVLFLFIYLLP